MDWWSTGNWTGNWSSGNWSTGNWSSGNYWTGNWSSNTISSNHYQQLWFCNSIPGLWGCWKPDEKPPGQTVVDVNPGQPKMVLLVIYFYLLSLCLGHCHHLQFNALDIIHINQEKVLEKRNENGIHFYLPPVVYERVLHVGRRRKKPRGSSKG